MKKLQVALDEYTSAQEAFEPIRKQIKTVEDRVLNIFIRNRGLISDNPQGREREYLEQVLANRLLNIEDNVRASLVDAHNFWLEIDKQLLSANSKFKLAEADLLAELEPLAKAHTDNLVKKNANTLAQATEAILAFSDSIFEAENLAVKTSAVQNAAFARSNWRAITDPVRQAKWLLNHAN